MEGVNEKLDDLLPFFWREFEVRLLQADFTVAASLQRLSGSRVPVYQRPGSV
jgi:hypothetical protein